MRPLVFFVFRTAPLLLCLCFATSGVRAQTPAPSPDTKTGADVVPAAPQAPAWLKLPIGSPPGWRIVESGPDTVTFAGSDTKVALARQAGSANKLLAALASQVGADVSGEPQTHHLSFGGPWVQGRLIDGAGRRGPRAVVAVRRLPGDRVVTAVVRGSKRGRGVGQALDLLATMRFPGVDAPPPRPPLDLEDRPDARINPVGLFVTLPEGWKPKLLKSDHVFWLRHSSARVKYGKASGRDLRALKTAAKAAQRYEGWTVQPALWHPPGHYRAWELLKLKHGDVVDVRHVYVVRYKKLDDWSYHIVEVEGLDPKRGFAHTHSLLRRLKLIP